MTDLPRSDTLELELDAGWLTVWFNEPERRNPLSAERGAALVALADAVHDRRDIRGVTIRGRGGVFCAGGDLRAFRMEYLDPANRDALVQLSRDGAEVFDAIDRLPQFTLVVIEGAAMAGGLGLACCGDMVLADRDARFGLSELRIGLVPAQITPFVQRRIGLAPARKLILSTEVLDANTAHAAGLVDEVCDDLGGRITEVQTLVHKAAPGALAVAKSLCADLPDLDRAAQIDRAAQDFATCLQSDEGREGLMAFATKRKPEWAT